jgi:hypothetical protein
LPLKALMAREQDMAAHAALKAEVALAAVKGDRIVRAGGSFVPASSLSLQRYNGKGSTSRPTTTEQFTLPKWRSFAT